MVGTDEDLVEPFSRRDVCCVTGGVTSKSVSIGLNAKCGMIVFFDLLVTTV